MKFFTPSEARRTLPLVRRIVADILNLSSELQYIVAEKASKYNGERITERIDGMKYYIKELEELGCKYRQYRENVGLVDFLSVIDGKEVFLCWKSDEETIKYYHGIDEGFAGRKLIPEEYLIM